MEDSDEHVDKLERERAARRKAERRVEELEARLEDQREGATGADRFVDVMEHAADMIQCVDTKGHYLYANQTWCESLGYDRSDLDELTIYDVVTPEYHELCDRMFEQLADGKCVGPVEMSFQTRDGERIAVEGLLNCRIEDGEAIWVRGVFRDVADRHHTRRVRDQFVSSFSDTLRTPLESIRDAVVSLDAEVAGDLSQKATYLLDLAEKGQTALNRMVEEIFEFERIRSGLISLELDEMDMAGVVRQVVESRQPMARELNVRLRMDTRLEQALVYGDRDRMAKAVDLLVKTALAASSEGSRVHVELTGDAESMRLCVHDQGALDNDLRFDEDPLTLVSRGDHSGSAGWQATGLEYSLAGSIIEAHGGVLVVERTERGALTSLELELVEPPLERRVESRPRVLVCEDDVICARLLRRLLEAGGYQVDVAATASEAQNLLARHDYEAMTLDLVLPDRNGTDLLHEIRQERADIPVVVVSATADEERANLSGDAVNVVDWLSKPFEVESLRVAVKTAVERASRDLPRILHVEDDADFQTTIADMLDGLAEISHVATLAQARNELQSHEDFDLVLLDLVLPDGLGAELLPFLNRPKGRPTPVVIISSGDATDALGAHVSATLVKSQTTQEQLLETITAHLDRAKPRMRS